ncbi:MAG: hypothetical protein HC830_10455 [Bacteroidetes bacterium]|nr:hypothetical protein [Bacteroidota bacterium]
MKKTTLLTASLILLTAGIIKSQQQPFPEDIYQYIENPAITDLNQEPGHTPLMPYITVNEALENNRTNSASFVSLNGPWKFHWAENPEMSPKNFHLEKFNDAAWKNIPVPSNWEMEGYGDPVFRNIAHPFKSNPPFIPRDYNPVGSYRKAFQLPAQWKGKQVFLRLEAVTSAFFLWINGKEVGFNKGANEPAEFNITPYLKAGKNTIAVKVFKYSDGTYLEDQDFWRLAGIFRDVFLFTTPDAHIRDYYISTDLDNDYKDATLSVNAVLKNYSGTSIQDLSIRMNIFDRNRKSVITTVTSQAFSVAANNEVEANISSKVINPAKWSSEKPNLYSLTLELLNKEGKVIEVLSTRFGFKEVEVKNQAILVNGVPVKLNGINSHMQHPHPGTCHGQGNYSKGLNPDETI